MSTGRRCAKSQPVTDIPDKAGDGRIIQLVLGNEYIPSHIMLEVFEIYPADRILFVIFGGMKANGKTVRYKGHGQLAVGRRKDYGGGNPQLTALPVQLGLCIGKRVINQSLAF